MTKSDLVDAVAGEAHLPKRQINQIVDLIFEEIKTALQNGDRVALIPFGSFVVRARAAREGRNPKTGDTIKIAARKIPAFVAGKSLRDAVTDAPNGKRRQLKSAPAHEDIKKKIERL